MTAPARRRWPLIVIGAAAGASTWSGWVGLGSLTGFGVVKPFPGIADGVALNTAITLPIGVEAYAVYALHIATSSDRLTDRARRFAWASSGAALALGMFGQAAYHLMTARGVTSAPPWVVVAVSCLPVLVLGTASLLFRLAGETVAVKAAAESINSAEVGTDAPAVFLDSVTAPAAEVRADTPQRQAPPQPRTPVTVPDAELARIIRAVLDESAAAGFGTVEKAIREAGWLVGNTQRVKDALRVAKNPTPLRVVAAGK